MREYERFEKGAANSNVSTSVLKRQLEDPDARIIITTIQKLARFVAQNKGHAIYDGHVVLIFDECHRSQFGDMHAAIDEGVQALPPVRLHRHADLRRERRHRRQPAAPHHRAGVRRPAAHLHDRRRDQRQERAAVPHRLRQHDQAAGRTSPTSRSPRSTPSGPARARADRPGRRLHPRALRPEDQAQLRLHPRRASGSRASTRCSPPPRSTPRSATTPSSRGSRPSCRRRSGSRSGSSTATPRTRTIADFLAEEEFETDDLDASSRDFLEGAISDYNAMFGTSFDTSSDKFQNYYKDLSLRLQNRELDLVDRRQHVPDRLRRDHAQHALGRQEPPRARPDPGLLAHEPDPQLGQDLRQHRHLPRPGGADERRARALRQQGRARHRPAQAVRRLLRRVRRAGRRAAGALPARRASGAGRARQDVHRALRRRSCGCATS